MTSCRISGCNTIAETHMTMDKKENVPLCGIHAAALRILQEAKTLKESA